MAALFYLHIADCTFLFGQLEEDESLRRGQGKSSHENLEAQWTDTSKVALSIRPSEFFMATVVRHIVVCYLLFPRHFAVMLEVLLSYSQLIGM